LKYSFQPKILSAGLNFPILITKVGIQPLGSNLSIFTISVPMIFLFSSKIGLKIDPVCATPLTKPLSTFVSSLLMDFEANKMVLYRK